MNSKNTVFSSLALHWTGQKINLYFICAVCFTLHFSPTFQLQGNVDVDDGGGGGCNKRSCNNVN